MRKIFLLDGYNLMYRMFYAVPPFTSPEGVPVNAVFGLAKMLLGFHNGESPDHLAVIMDSKAQNFRSAIYPEYKAQRDRMPDDLRAQESLIFELFDVMGIPMIAKEGFEADDIIGTFATRLGTDSANDIYIVSGDKDLYQFVGDRIAVYDTMKRVTARRKEALEKFGVPPEHVVDYLAIVGDSSDNIPGIAGFGPKKAESLIGAYGSLESIYEHADEVTGKAGETLRASKEVAFLSKQLATIDTNVDVAWDSEATRFRDQNLLNDRSIEFFKRLNFKSLLPASESKTTNFDHLKLQAVEIADHTALDALLERILSTTTSISLTTYYTDSGALGVIIGLSDGKELFSIRSDRTSVGEFFDRIFASNTEIIGYDLKSDIRRIRMYEKRSETPAGIENLTLF